MDSPNPRKHSAHPPLRQDKQVKINNGTSYHITSDLFVDAFVMHGEMEWSKYSKYVYPLGYSIFGNRKCGKLAQVYVTTKL